jgi:hypothetical protein
MKFRRNCFAIIALLTSIIACLWITGGLVNVSADKPETEAEQAGQTIGAGLGVGIILCITIPIFALFALLS